MNTPNAPRSDRTPRLRLDADTRQRAILAAATTAFAGSPYAEVSVASIAREAGASEALVFRYFGSKGGLYAAVVRAAIDDLVRRQRERLDQIPIGAPVRDHIRAGLEVYLDHIASHPTAWSAPFLIAGNEPPEALEARRRARESYVTTLMEVLALQLDSRRDRYAAWGYFGFLDGACLAWVQRGCPEDDRGALIDAALGALEGALGDWGR